MAEGTRRLLAKFGTAKHVYGTLPSACAHQLRRLEAERRPERAGRAEEKRREEDKKKKVPRTQQHRHERRPPSDDLVTLQTDARRAGRRSVYKTSRHISLRLQVFWGLASATHKRGAL